MLRLSRDQAEAIIEHARAEVPNECCGLLGGRDGRVERVYRGTNVDRSPFSYQMDPKEQLAAFRELDDAGLELIGIYHSHTASPAYPSRTDVAKALYPEALYLIVSLAGDPEVRAFRISDGRIAEEDVVIE